MKKQLINKLCDKRLDDALSGLRVDFSDGDTLFKFFYQIANPPQKVVSKSHYKKTMTKIKRATFLK